MTDTTIMASFADLAEDQRQLAMARFAVLQPTLENDVPLIRAAAQPGGAAVDPLAAVAQLPPAAIAPRQPAIGTQHTRESGAPARWLRLLAGLAVAAVCGTIASRRP